MFPGGLQPAGVQAVVQNLSGFLTGLGQMNRAMAQFGNTAASAATGPLSLAGKVLGTLGSAFMDVSKIALGLVTGNIIANLAGQIGKLNDMVTRAATNLQLLTVRLNNLIAMQMRAADASLTYEDAMAKVGNVTRETLEWITRMSFATPFNVDQIQNAFTLQLAMGFNIETTKDLTKAMMDFVAGAGLGNEVMERIIYNLAQMKNQGKVTGTELRDLARGAFVPVDEILRIAAKNMGVAAEGMQEFREAAAEGKISVDEFFKAFIQFANESFPDAAYKMNITMDSLEDNIKDFFKIQIGWNVFGETVARAAGILNELFKNLITPGVTQEFRLLGKAILDAFNTIVAFGGRVRDAIVGILEAFGIRLPTISQFIRQITVAVTTISVIIENLGHALTGFVNKYIMPFITGLTTRLGGTLADTANKAFTWGANIIINLAEGIIKGAAAALEAAMNFISRLFASWLAPGSPPRILPEIQAWGAKAFAEYLRGFSMADFTLLDSVQNALKGALDALVGLGDLGEKAGAGLFKGLSEDLIKAIAQFNRTGEMSSEIFKKLSQIGGGFGKELAELLKRQVALARATERAEAAQKALNAAQDATKRAVANVNRLTREYNNLLRSGADKEALKRKLAQLNAAEKDMDVAKKREKAAELANDEAKKALEPLKEAVSLQEKLIQELIELARAQRDITKDGGGEGGGGGGVPPIEVPPIDVGGIGDAIEAGLDELFKRIRQSIIDKLGGVWEALKERWLQTIQPLIDVILKKWGGFIDTLEKWWNELVDKFRPIWETVIGIIFWAWDIITKFIDIQLELLKTNIARWGAFLEGWWTRHGANLILLVNFVWNGILEFISSTLAKILMGVLLFIGWLEGFWQRHGDKLIVIWTVAWTFINQVLMTMLEIIGMVIDAFAALIQGDWQTFVDTMETAWATFWATVYATATVMTALTNTLVAIAMTELYRIVIGAFEAALKWLGEQIESWRKAGNDLIAGLGDGIVAGLFGKGGVLSTIVLSMLAVISAAKDALGIKSPSSVFYSIGQELMQGLINGILTKIGAVTAAIVAAIRLAIANALSQLGGLVGGGKTGGGSGGGSGGGGGGFIPESLVPEVSQQAASMAMSASYQYLMSAQAQMASTPPVMRQTSISFGDTNIYSGIDAQLFYAMVRQAIREEL